MGLLAALLALAQPAQGEVPEEYHEAPAAPEVGHGVEKGTGCERCWTQPLNQQTLALCTLKPILTRRFKHSFGNLGRLGRCVSFFLIQPAFDHLIVGRGTWEEVVPEVREDITSQRATVFDTIEGGGRAWLKGKARRKLPSDGRHPGSPRHLPFKQ